MALTKLTDLQPLHVHSIGISTFDGSVSVGGTLTYEDVTNIDSVGIVTARTGIKVLAGGINVVGVVTATSFVGSGANLTGISPNFTSIASNIVPDSDNARDLGTSSARWNELYIQSIKGNQNQHILYDANGAIEMFANSTQFIGMKVNGKGLEIRNNSRVIPTTSGAINFGDASNKWNEIHANSFHGDGSNLTGITGTTINNNADNRVITGSGTANTLEAESSFTFDGTTVQIPDRINCNTNGTYLKENQLSFNPTGTAYLDHYRTGQNIQVRMSSSSSLDTTGPTFKSNGNLAFASGKGIDFSATGGASGGAEILDDYEEGSWTPAVSSGNASFSTRTGRYVKIGRQVTIWFRIAGGGSYSGSGGLQINGLPFSNNSAVQPIGNSEYYKIDFARDYSDHVTPYIVGQNIQWLRNGSGGGSGNYLTVNLFYSGAAIQTCLIYNTNS